MNHLPKGFPFTNQLTTMQNDRKGFLSVPENHMQSSIFMIQISCKSSPLRRGEIWVWNMKFHWWVQSLMHVPIPSLIGDNFWITSTVVAHAHLNNHWLTHWGRDKMAAISQTTLSNAFSWMKLLEFRLKFHWSLFLRAQLTIFQHWFR